MSQPATHRILKLPLAFFGLPFESDAARKALEDYLQTLKEGLIVAIKDIVTEQQQKKKLSPAEGETANELNEEEEESQAQLWIQEAVAVMPLVLLRLPDDIEIPIPMWNILLAHPYVVYSAHLKEPNIGLANILRGNYEYSYHIIEENSRRKREGKALIPLGPLSEQETCDGMANSSPYWALRYLKLNYSEAYYNRILAGTYQLRENTAEHAHFFHWLCHHGAASDVRKMEMEKILPTVAMNPWYAILVALEFPTINVEELIHGQIIQSPLWVYNWLHLVGRGPRELLVEKLLACPPWAIQYIEDLNPKDAGELLERIREKNDNPWWKEWCERYYQRWKQKYT